MRVLLTTILIKSGLLTHVWDLARFLKNQKVSVSVAIYTDNPNLSPTNLDSYSSSLLGPIANVPFCFYRSTKELHLFAREQKVQLVHAHSSATYIKALELCKTRNLPLLLTLHGVARWQENYPEVLDFARKIIAVGPAQATSAGSQYLNKMSIITNGVDIQKFKPKSLQTDLREPLKILWFGRTHGSASSGVLALDEAVSILRWEGKSIEARMVGRAVGAETNALDTYGWISNPLPYLQWSNVTFGHGRSLREAMSCGNIGFLLGHGYGGRVKPNWFSQPQYMALSAIPEYSLPTADPQVIASDLRELYQGRSLLYRLRQEARKIAEDNFDVRSMVSKTEQVYRRILKQ